MSLQEKCRKELCENLIKMYGTTYQDLFATPTPDEEGTLSGDPAQASVAVLKDHWPGLLIFYIARVMNPGLP